MGVSIYGQDSLTVNQYEIDKYLYFTDSSGEVLSLFSMCPTKVSFVVGKDPSTNELITIDVVGDTIGKAPIPNQLLDGSCSGEIKFYLNYLHFGNWVKVSSPSASGVLTINKADRPSNYVFTPTLIINDYNAEMTISYSKLLALYINNFDTNKFYTKGCTSLKNLFANSYLYNIDCGNFDTSNVTVMFRMFFALDAITTLDLSSFDTSKVTRMEGMFQSCHLLSSLDLSSFDTSKVTNMNNMFTGCTALTTLTLSQDWGVNTEITNLDLSACPLTHDSCLDVFNKLADKTQTATTSATLTLNSTTKALMSDTEITIATTKGWKVS